MPRLGIGMPLVSTATEAPVLAVQDFFWLNDISGELTPIHTASRTNLVTYSEDFSSWTTSGVTPTPDYGISPDGTQNSTRLVYSAASKVIYKLSVHSGNTETNTIYVKGVSGETIKFGKGATVNVGDVFTLNGNWQRIEYVSTTGNQISISTYSGATARDIQIWGVQIEQDSRASAYIPTSGSTVTVTTPLNDTHNAWDYDSANLMLEEDPDSEGSWERPPNVVLNHNFADLGAELVTDEDFPLGTTAWSTDTGWSVGGGVASSDGTNSAKLYQNVGVAASKSYEYIIEVKTLTSGTISLYYHNGSYQTIALNLGLGTHNLRFSTSGTPNGFIYVNSNSFIGSIDNVSVKQIDPNDRWTKSAEWSISEEKATCSGGASKTLYQSNILPLGTLYEIKFTVSSYTSGYLSAFSGDWDALGVIDSTGTFVRRSVSLGTNTGLVGNSFIGTVDNVTVNEYAAMPLDV